MPNYVKNILSFDGDQDQVSRLFSTIQGENGPVDFDKLIPMPSELEIESGSRTAAGFKKYMEFVADTGLHTEMEPAYLAAHRKSIERNGTWENRRFTTSGNLGAPPGMSGAFKTGAPSGMPAVRKSWMAGFPF